MENSCPICKLNLDICRCDEYDQEARFEAFYEREKEDEEGSG